MFEATLVQGSILRKIVDSLKDLVTEVNLEATPSGISIILLLKEFHSKQWMAHMFPLFP